MVATVVAPISLLATNLNVVACSRVFSVFDVIGRDAYVLNNTYRQTCECTDRSGVSADSFFKLLVPARAPHRSLANDCETPATLLQIFWYR